MIKNYLLLLALCFLSSIKAQVINIPDANFKAKLLEADFGNSIARDKNGNVIKIDSDGNGEIEQNEIPYCFKSSITGFLHNSG